MVVKKSDFSLGYLTEKQRKELEELCERIDRVLTENYVGGEPISIDIGSYPHKRVMKILEDRYKEAGWDIIFHSDQRDGDYIVIS